MTNNFEKKLIKKYQIEYHYIDFCPSCGEKIKSKMITLKELKRIIKNEN